MRQLNLHAWIDTEHLKKQSDGRRIFQVYARDLQPDRPLDRSKRIGRKPLSEEEVMWYNEFKKPLFVTLGLHNNSDLMCPSDNWDGSLDNQEKILEDDYTKGRR